jgi:hypothetical protein
MMMIMIAMASIAIIEIIRGIGSRSNFVRVPTFVLTIPLFFSELIYL